jgi:hypothetical protein
MCVLVSDVQVELKRLPTNFHNDDGLGRLASYIYGEFGDCWWRATKDQPEENDLEESQRPAIPFQLTT